MPYELKKQGSKYCVFNKDTGESKGCSDTREMAVKHMRALYANEGKKEFELVEVVNVDDALDSLAVYDKAVDAAHTHEHTHGHYHEHTHDGSDAHSHWHGHQHEHSHDHSEESHSHYHVMHDGDVEAHAHGDVDHMHEASSWAMDNKEACECAACVPVGGDSPLSATFGAKAIRALPDSAFAHGRHFPISNKAFVRHSLSHLPGSEFEKAALARVHAAAKEHGLLHVKQRSLWQHIVDVVQGSHAESNLSPCASGASIVTTKSADGRTRVVMRVSNMFKDRHGEIITQEAHKEYEQWVDQTGKYPEFWLWHIKGSRWGQADFVSFSDGFLTVSGLVDPGYELVAEQLANRQDIGVSHGFYGASITGKGFIDLYRSFECSPLPVDQAANLWTALLLAKEADLPLSPAKRKFLADVGLPDGVIDAWDEENKTLKDLLTAGGIEFKDTEPDPPEPEPKPDPVPTIADVLTEVRALGARLDETSKELADLKTKSADYVASVLEPAIKPGAPVGHVASKASDNVAGKDEIKKDEWFENTVLKGMI